MFYLVCTTPAIRTGLIHHLRSKGILAVFHYLSLHVSAFAQSQPGYILQHLPNADRYTDCLVRLPLYFDLATAEVEEICDEIKSYCKAKR